MIEIREDGAYWNNDYVAPDALTLFDNLAPKQQVDEDMVLQDVDTVRVWALDLIDYMRGEARRPLLTVTYAQELDYTDKSFQARAWLQDPAPDPINYPKIYGGEAQQRGLDAQEMVDLIMSRANQMSQADDIINATALAAVAAVEAASKSEEIVQVLAATVWPGF